MPDDYFILYVNVRSYVKSTLHVIMFLLALAIPQWMLLSIFSSQEHIFYSLMCFWGSFLLLTAIHMIDALKYKWPWNWMAVCACYELITLGIGTFAMNTSLRITMMSVTMSMLIFGLMLTLCFFIIIGFSYPNPYTIAALSVLGFIMAICVLALNMVYYWPHWVDLAVVFFMISVLSIMLSYVLISFENIDILTKADTMLVGFVLYLNYLLILVASFVAIERIKHNFGLLLENRPHQQFGLRRASPYN
ncbi:hypothetical protein KR222_007911 [Zaprionus bogoriensis]|nr:hypothetical protein KR222_007911 [Zaprionus bogoriensis]